MNRPAPGNTPPAGSWGLRAAAWLEQLSQCSEAGAGVTRLPYTAEHRQCLALLQPWMQEIGLAVSLDAAGTLIGHRPADDPSMQASASQRPALLLGSHQDSVRQGGAFDGIMGVIVPLLALEMLRAEDTKLPFDVEVLAFADEEGVRFPTALFGSRAIAGSADPAVLELTDRNGISMRDAMRGFGLPAIDDPACLAASAQRIFGYIETHIEQGPVLEDAGLALGVVDAICGIERHQVCISGQSGHAGTVPMQGRRDALLGAARLIERVHQETGDSDSVRATIGELHVSPNAVNAIPGEVQLTLEVRSPDDQQRTTTARRILSAAAGDMHALGLGFHHGQSYQQAAVACSPALIDILQQAVCKTGQSSRVLSSGATHDASAMAALCPIGMLFVRCRGGLSHVPEEAVTCEDLERAIRALAETLRLLAHRCRSEGQSTRLQVR